MSNVNLTLTPFWRKALLDRVNFPLYDIANSGEEVIFMKKKGGKKC